MVACRQKPLSLHNTVARCARTALLIFTSSLYTSLILGWLSAFCLLVLDVATPNTSRCSMSSTAETRPGLEPTLSHTTPHTRGKPATSEVPFTEKSKPQKNGRDVEILTWDGPNDPENPFNWTKKRKWLVTAAALFSTLVTCWNGTSITVAAYEINDQFNVSDANFPNSYWPVTSWSVGGAIFVVLFLPLMEDIGVRWGYLITYTVFLLFIVPQAVAQNFATLIVTRFFSGGCAALLANTIASVIPDVWETDEERSFPVGLYILLYLGGTTTGPEVFGGVVQYLSTWRW